MTDSHNKINIPQSLNVMDSHGDNTSEQRQQHQGGSGRRNTASRELYTILNQIVRKLNAVDSLDSATATAAQIVQALQK